MNKPEFLGVLTNYCDVIEGAVIVKGGELLRFIGDAVLAIFPIDDADTSAERAENVATEAFCEVNTRLDAANAHRERAGDASIAFGAGLHVGEVLRGNFGIPEHFELSVIGAVTNEGAPIECLIKQLGRDVLASRAFVDLHLDCWHSVGPHVLRDVGEKVEFFAFGKDA